MSSDEAAVLVFEDVRLAFAGVVAIDGVSFTVGQQELFAIIGPNGAGKTSIFNVLSGVYRPQRGRVVFDGKDLLGRRPHQIAAAGLARPYQAMAANEPYVRCVCRPSMMLSSTVRLANSSTFWNVRARPAAAIWCGRRPSRSLPSKTTRPR